jgi:UDP-N-acetylglucosamine 4,6-dehydratase
MKKNILVTGGSGSIGRAFISRYYREFNFFNLSRNEGSQTKLKRTFPNVTNYIGSIEDGESVCRAFEKARPDIVIHAAAMKHIDIIEREPIQACRVNILGSLNVISASRRYDVPVTVAVGTDKACSSESVYGDTKYLMERCFMDANSDSTKFAACRFANVAHTEGSVIPFWLTLKAKKLPLRLTDPKMNRLIFSSHDAAGLIMKTVLRAKNKNGGFIGTTQMKAVNMLSLAKLISKDIEVIGARAGEKNNEDLINAKELPYTCKTQDLVIITEEESAPEDQLKEPYNTLTADFMTEEEMRDLIYPPASLKHLHRS